MLEEQHSTSGGIATWSLIAVGTILVAVGTATTMIGCVILLVAWLQTHGGAQISNTVAPDWGIADATEGAIALGLGVVILVAATLLLVRGINRRFVLVEYGPRRSSTVPYPQEW